MEVKNAKALVNDGTVLGDLKRKRAVRCATYFTDAAQALISRSDPNQPAIKRHKILRSDGCENSGTCYFGKPMLKNYENVKKSGLPQRVLFYQNGAWNNFPVDVVDLIREAFQSEKFMIEIMFKGYLALVDFLHMVQIDLNTGSQQSIAWIDESGRCFFPELCSDTDELHGCSGFNRAKDQTSESCDPNGTREIKVHLEIGISGKDSSNAEECDEVSTSHVNRPKVQEKLDGNCNEMKQDCSTKKKSSAAIKETILEDCSPAIAIREPKFMSHRIYSIDSQKSDSEFGKLVRLVTGSSDYIAVQNMFLLGLSQFANEIDIVGIYHSPLTSVSLQTRLQAFQKQVEITEKFRGNANVRCAWYGSSREAAMRIMSHGFGINENSNHSPSYGTGIYLTPGNCSFISAKYCDVDENGIQHMLLCRVIMGRMEPVGSGSEQFHPSSEEFDSGVDDIENPKHYIIWNMHMSTHIYPEYLVSFQVPSNVKEYWSGLTSDQSKSNESGITNSTSHHNQIPHLLKQSQEKAQGCGSSAPKKPTSAWMTLPMLFAAISSKISAEAQSLIYLHYSDFKGKRISRDALIKKLRHIVGDKLLKSTLESFQRKNVPF